MLRRQHTDATRPRPIKPAAASGLLLFSVLCLLAFAARAETFAAYVVGVTDGDTVTVVDAARQQGKIRLAGIDAPEKAQPFGERSRQALAAMVFNRNVVVEWQKRDRYGRMIGKIWLNGIDASQAQLEAGMAWWYRDYAREQSADDRREYELAERQARDRRVGLWRDVEPMPPWAWRKARRGG